MKLLKPRKYPIWVQFAICIGLVLLCSGISFLFSYPDRVVALMLLLSVSLLAMLFEIVPVVVAAVMSVFIWIFFSPPGYSYRINDREEALFFLFYFLVVLINILLTFKIRQVERKARDKEKQDNVIILYDTLLNSLSHELRTPVSSIIGALDTLNENRDTLSPENTAELLSVIGKASFRLDREVDNLLNMSRLESGMLKLHIDWCDLSEIVYRAIRKLMPYGNSVIEFNPDKNMPFFRLDAGIIEQVIYNLLHNALRHTPDNTLISVMLKHDENSCVITITDNGPGFPEHEISRVFNKFHRLTTSKPGGSGLGLSIVKGFVEAHNGTVTLENIPGGGARFTVAIPAEASSFNNLVNE